MQELTLTWSHVIRIWWAAFWRWLILANLSVGIGVGIIGIVLWAAGIRIVPSSPWLTAGIYLLTVPAGFISLRLAFKAKYHNFRIAIISDRDAV